LSSGDLLRKLHWLPVQSRIEFKIACITHKVLTTGQPSYLNTLLNHCTPPHTLRSGNQYLLQHLRVSTEFAKRSFSYLAPKLWNNIPLDIRLCSTPPTFKRHLKTYLHRESKKGCHPNHGYNFANFGSICKILSLLQRAVKYQQNSYYVTHHTLSMLLHYLGKLKN